MIVVRILDEGQFVLDDGTRDELVARDARLLAALESDDAEAYRAEIDGLVNYVRANGSELALDVIMPSEFVLPNDELSMDDVRGLLADHSA